METAYLRDKENAIKNVANQIRRKKGIVQSGRDG